MMKRQIDSDYVNIKEKIQLTWHHTNEITFCSR